MTPIRQSQAAECSLACFCMVAGHHGLRMDLDTMRKRFSTSLKGSNLQTMVAQAQSLGFEPRPLQLDLHELAELQTPCVLHWGMNHAVVLAKVHRSPFARFSNHETGSAQVETGGITHITILDPAIGRRRLPIAEVAQQFTGVALELSPGANFKKEDLRAKVPLSQFTGTVTGLKRSLAQIFAVALVLQAFGIVAPMYNQLVVDEVLTSGDKELLGVLALGFALLMLTQTLLGLARGWMVLVLSQSVALQWASNVFSHMVRLPASFFDARHLGDVSSRFGATGAIQGTLTTGAVTAVLDGIMCFAALAMMLIYAPMLALLTIAAVAGYALVRVVSYQPFREAQAERLVLGAKESTHFLETLRAIQPLKLFGRETERTVRWRNLRVDVQNRDTETAKMGIWFGTANTAIFGLLGIGTFYVGAKMVMGGVNQSSPFTIGMLFAFTSYQGQFTARIGSLIDFAVQLRMLSLHTERLGDIVLTEPEKEDPALALQDWSHLQPSIELRNVSFRYGEGERWVLRHIHLKVEPGESLAIVGASGGGKTTLLKIMLGLLQPLEGEVLMGGVPLQHMGLRAARNLVGTVMQDDVLLSGNLQDNICFFDLQPDATRAQAAAKLAQVHDEIMAMPMAYQTLVGDLGSGLSGGQKQRVLLARALYKQPKILALDEATSHLDVTNERAVTNALAQLPLTRVVIAHRPETIAGAKRVVQLTPQGREGAGVAEVMRAVA